MPYNITNFQSSIIPAELRALNQWVCWRYEDRNGKRTKPPIDAKSNGKLLYAKSNNPETWSDFDTAVATAARLNLEGIGLALAESDGLTGLDLDHVLDADTGELDPLAREVLERFKDTYIEVSPSGAGLRIWCYGKPQRSGKCEGKTKWLEVYDHSSPRYLTVTGNRYGSEITVTDQQEALNWLHGRFMVKLKDESTEKRELHSQPVEAMDDQTLLEKARQSKNGLAFDALWSGDTSAHNEDASSADLALLNLLAFWTGKDSTRMDRLFRQSGLMRDKWDESHYSNGQTYGQASLDKAITDCREVYSGKSNNSYFLYSESPEQVKEKTDCLFSDYGNAVILRDYLSGELAYTPGIGWLGYDENTGVWEFEPGTEKVREKTMRTLRAVWTDRLNALKTKQVELSKQLKGMDSEDHNYNRLMSEAKVIKGNVDKTANWLTQCESAYRVRTALDVADGILLVKSDVLDSTPDILVCKNGVLNLITGELMPHSPKYFSTKSTGAHYDPNASHPAWDAVVELLKSEEDRYELIHQFCGSGIHHENPSEKILIAQGDGGTGKGTLLTGIHNALGDYVATIEINTLLQTDWRKAGKSAPREDLLKLRGARFVYPSIEPPKGAKLDDGTIKALSTSDVITARYPHVKQSISFVPVFKLFMQTNFPLQTNFDDPGMKRRVIICPFDKKPAQPDPSIKSALMNDPQAKAAVLRWMFEGYRNWRDSGYRLPDSYYASTATEAYWSEMNPFEQFSNDCLIFTKGAKTSKGDMSDAFKQWREETGRRGASLQDLTKWLKGKKVYEDRDPNPKARTRLWGGVELANVTTTNNTNNICKKQSLEEVPSFHIENFHGNDVRNVRNVQKSQNLSSPVEADPLAADDEDAAYF